MTNKDAISVLSGCLRRSRGTISRQVQDVDEWLYNFLYQSVSQSRIKKVYCEVCGRRHDPPDLELHHPAGRKHDYRTITVCKACHCQVDELCSVYGGQIGSFQTSRSG